MFTQDDYRVGSTLTYATFGGGHRTVRVTNLEQEIANGRSGFDGVLLDLDGKETQHRVWGYTDQIIRVGSY